MLSDYAVRANVPAAADEAISLAPLDAEAYSSRAVLFAGAGQASEAVAAYERALSLRPRDYALWLDLGREREEAGNVAGALAALRQSATLAPFYAQPHWQLGNALLRSGSLNNGDAASLEEAFDELQRASRSDPTLFPKLIELSWSASGGDPQAVEQLFHPEAPEEKLALARLFAKHGHPDAAVRLFEAAGEVGKEERRTLLLDLLAAKQFAQARRVWAAGHPPGADATEAVGIVNGGFESEIRLDDLGFGWQFATPAQGWKASIDSTSGGNGGSRCLRIDFTGMSNPSLRLISQLVLVEPGARYQVRFAVRTEKIVTGGLPRVAILDAVKEGEPLLADSASLPPDSNSWRDFAIDLQIPPKTSAIIITIQREPCAGGPCPAFGSLWLDNFVLRRL